MSVGSPTSFASLVLASSPLSAVTVDKDLLAADLHAFVQELEYRSHNVAKLSKWLPDKPGVEGVRHILAQRHTHLTDAADTCRKACELVCVAA